LAEMGWRAPIKLEEEIGDAYRWYPAPRCQSSWNLICV